VHLFAGALPAAWRATTAAKWVVETCVYDAAIGAAGLWLMGARWWQWLGLYWAWAAATVWLNVGGGRAAVVVESLGAVARGLRRLHGGGGGDGKAGGKGGSGKGADAGGAATGAALLQLGVPLFLGWVVPWL
jgi:hypothetical protein